MPKKIGRPPKFDEPDKQKLYDEFAEYIASTDVPVLATFAASKGLWKQYFYDHKEFTNLVKLCATKKEGALEEGALTGKLNAPMAIFSLKQLGWKDRAEKIVFVDPASLTEAEIKALLNDGKNE